MKVILRVAIWPKLKNRSFIFKRADVKLYQICINRGNGNARKLKLDFFEMKQCKVDGWVG